VTDTTVARETDRGPVAAILTIVSVTLHTMDELPVLQEEPPLRADAARNRDKVLAAAEKLFAESTPDCVTMDAVAAEAGVGKGTLFRGFGDRAGLVMALLQEHERRLQEDLIRGPAPLGPGAPAIERLIAFGRRLLKHLAQHGALIAAADGRLDRYRAGPFAVYRVHVGLLVREAAADADWEYLTDTLLASLVATHVNYMRNVRGMSTERLAAGWEDLVRRLLSCR
jgi:AcrR family transcriptional regulator